MKFCFRCGLRVEGGVRKYCSDDCIKQERRDREAKSRIYKKNLDIVEAAWRKRHPGLTIYPGWPHKFNEELNCEFCNVQWNQSRLKKKGVQCTNPDRYGKIRINNDGKPKMIRNDPPFRKDPPLK